MKLGLAPCPGVSLRKGLHRVAGSITEAKKGHTVTQGVSHVSNSWGPGFQHLHPQTQRLEGRESQHKSFKFHVSTSGLLSRAIPGLVGASLNLETATSPWGLLERGIPGSLLAKKIALVSCFYAIASSVCRRMRSWRCLFSNKLEQKI